MKFFCPSKRKIEVSFALLCLHSIIFFRAENARYRETKNQFLRFFPLLRYIEKSCGNYWSLIKDKDNRSARRRRRICARKHVCAVRLTRPPIFEAFVLFFTRRVNKSVSNTLRNSCNYLAQQPRQRNNYFAIVNQKSLANCLCKTASNQ